MSKILVVDDSGVIRKMVIKIVTDAGYEYLEAEHGQIALEILETNDISLVITDINMPVMDGLELSRNIRKLSTDKKSVPIIILSTEFSDKIKAEGKEIGVNAWMIKPCGPEKLNKALDHFLK